MVALLIEEGIERDRRSVEGHHLISPSSPVAALIQTYINTITKVGKSQILMTMSCPSFFAIESKKQAKKMIQTFQPTNRRSCPNAMK